MKTELLLCEKVRTPQHYHLVLRHFTEITSVEYIFYLLTFDIKLSEMSLNDFAEMFC